LGGAVTSVKRKRTNKKGQKKRNEKKKIPKEGGVKSPIEVGKKWQAPPFQGRGRKRKNDHLNFPKEGRVEQKAERLV